MDPFAEHDHLNLEHTVEGTPLPYAPIEIPPRRPKLPLKPLLALVVIIAVSAVGWRYLRIDYNKSLASGPNLPILYGQNLAGNLTAAQLKIPATQQKLISDVRTGYGKTWDLAQLALPTNPPDPFPPDRALLYYPQIITLPTGAKARVEGGGVSMLINAAGDNDDVLVDNVVPDVPVKNPNITAAQASARLTAPLDAIASTPELVYHFKPQPTPPPGPGSPRPLNSYQLAYRVEITDGIKPFISDDANAATGGRGRPKDILGINKAKAANAPVSQNKGNGLTGKYYCYQLNGNNPLVHQFDRLEKKNTPISFNWGTGSPVSCTDIPGRAGAPDQKNDHFYVQWEGFIEPKFSEEYTFYFDVDSYGTLKINNTTIEVSKNSPPGIATGKTTLIAGHYYPISIYMTETTGKAKAVLSWSSPSTKKAKVPRSQLYTMLPPSPPTIGAIPDVSVTETQSITIIGAAAGTAPISYQWQKGGVNIANATGKNYIVVSAKPSDSGVYRVIATNAVGSAVSNDVTVTVAPIVGGAGTGLKGYYYTDTGLTKLSFSRVDETVNFGWGPGAPFPAPSQQTDQFSVRWYGQVNILTPGDYFFGIATDDGGRLWIDGKLIIDNWYVPDVGVLWGNKIAMTTGKHTVRYDYYEGTGGAGASLYWTLPGTPVSSTVIPKTMLYPLDFVIPTPNVKVGTMVYVDALNGTIMDTIDMRSDAHVSERSISKNLLALVPTPTPSSKSSKSRPAKDPTNALTGGGGSEDMCINDNYFGGIYYNNSDWTDATSAKFKTLLNDTWNNTSPASGITADGTWSVRFDTAVYNTQDTMTKFLPTFQGTLRIFKNGQPIFDQTNSGAPQEYSVSFFMQSGISDSFEIRYANNNNPQATLQLREVNCDPDGSNCNAKHVLFDQCPSGSGCPAPYTDTLSYTQKPSDKTGIIGTVAQFSMNYTNTGTPTTVQWQTKLSTEQNFFNVDGNGKTYGYVIQSNSDNGARVRAQLSNGVCQMTDAIKTAMLTVNTPNQDVSCSPAAQDTDLNTPATLNAAGGNGIFNWSATGGSPATGTGAQFRPSYSTAGTKNISVTSPGAANTATCAVVVVTPTPTPTPTGENLSLSCDPTTADKNEPFTATAVGGAGNYSWDTAGGSPNGCPGAGMPTCTDSFTTKYTGFYGPRTIKVTRGSDTATCDVMVATPTPTPPPELACSPLSQEAGVNDDVTLTAAGGSGISYKWTANGGNPGTGAFNAFTTKYATTGTKNITLENGAEKKTCTVTVSQVQTPTPTPPATEQSTELWVYDKSPIDAGDCGKTASKYPTKEFPLGECDPHLVTGENAPPITNSTKGLAWRGINESYNLVTVVAKDPDDTVVDGLSDDSDAARFNYPSLFDGTGQDKKKLIQVAQVQAYKTIMKSLKDFAKNMWPGGADPSNLYRPAGPAFADLSIRVKVGPIDPAYFNCNEKNEDLSLEWPCALDSAVTDHELFHIIEHRIVDNAIGHNSLYNVRRDVLEADGLDEGLADYFALRSVDDASFIGKYVMPKWGLGNGRKILELIPSEVAYPFITYKEGENIHPLGARLANILLQMKNYIKTQTGANDSEYQKLFDHAIIEGYRSYFFIAAVNRSGPSSSVFQDFYIQVYENLVHTNSFPETGATYFKNLLYNQAKIGTAVGGAGYLQTIRPSWRHYDDPFDEPEVFLRSEPLTCSVGPGGKKNPDYNFYIPSINAIGTTVTGLTVNFKDTASPIVKTYTYNNTTPQILSQKTMHTPIIGFTPHETLDFNPAKSYKVYFTVITGDGKTSQPIYMPDFFKVDRTGCD